MARNTSKSRWWLIPLPLLVLVVAAELVLRVAWRPPEVMQDTYLQRPFYVVESQSNGVTTYITHGSPPPAAPTSAAPPIPQDPRKLSPARFVVPKPAGIVRIFVVGSSPIYGGPGLGRFTLSTYLRTYLERARPDTRFEIIDSAAQQMSAATLTGIVEEIGAFGPDFALLYVGGAAPTLDTPGGHETTSEHPTLFSVSTFFRKLFLVRIWGPSAERMVEEFFAAVDRLASGTEKSERTEINMHRNMLRLMKDQLVDVYTEMASTAAKFPGHVAFYEVVTDLAGSSPVWSLHFKELTADQEAEFRRELLNAERLADLGDFAPAEQAALRALAIDDTFAAAQYIYGRALLGLGRAEEAYTALDNAREADASHDRLLAAPQRQLARALRQHKLALLPANRAFREASPTGVPGRELFRDITHPTPLGEAVLGRLGAQWVLANLPRTDGVSDPSLPTAKQLVEPAPPPPIPAPPPPEPGASN